MPVTEELTSEIDSAVTDVMEAITQDSEVAVEASNDTDTGAVEDEEVGDGQTTTEETDNEGSGDEDAVEGDDQADSEVGGATSEEESEEGDGEGVAPAISDGVITSAIQAGMSMEDVRSFSSEGQLLRTVELLSQAAAAATFEASATEDVAEKEDGVLDSLPKLDPEQVEPEVIKMFEVFTGVIRKQQEAIDGFREYKDQAARANQDAAVREATEWFDTQIKGLGEDFHSSLGVGNYGMLTRGSSQVAKRDEIANQIAVMIAGYEQTGQHAPSREAIFSAAARLVLHDEYGEAQTKKISKSLAKRKGQHVSRVGGSGTKSKQDPDAETAAMLDERFG